MSKPWRAIVLILATTSSAMWGAPTVSATSNDTRNAAQMSQTEKNILTLDNDTISCSLPEGDTTFIISLVRSSARSLHLYQRKYHGSGRTQNCGLERETFGRQRQMDAGGRRNFI